MAFDEYRDARLHPPINASKEARSVADLLAPLGGAVVGWDEAGTRDLTSTDQRLRRWSAGAHGRSSMLLWFGHGESNQDDAWLALPGPAGTDSDARMNPLTLAEHIARHIRERGTGPDWTLVLVEACGAKRFVDLMEAELLRARATAGLVLVATGKDQGRGYLSVFRECLAKVLATYNDNYSEIGMRDLVWRLEEQLETGGHGAVNHSGLVGVRALARPSRLSEPLTAPIDVYTKLQTLIAGLPVHERVHFARRGVGTALGELSWNFVGRSRERQRITDWLAGAGSGMLVVTGRPGSGKSAVLGNVLLNSYPEINAILARAGFPGAGWANGSTLPRLDLSIPLTGANVDDVTTAIARAADVTVPGAALSASERTSTLTSALRSALSRSGRTLIVMADALDEAREPLVVAALFRQLAEVADVRLVVGTRSSTVDEAQLQADVEPNLLHSLGAVPSQTLWIERDEESLAELVSTSLEQLRSEHGEGFDVVLDHVAALITGGKREFLYAGLAIHEVLADPCLLRPERVAELVELLSGDQGDLFEAAVARVTRAVPCGGQALAALALAQGRGLPQADRVWATSAAALGAEQVHDDGIGRVQKIAAPYIMVDAEAGQAVFRLAHRTFQEHFVGGAQGPRHQLALATALLELAERQEGPLNPYLARHLSGHLVAAMAYPWQELSARPDILDRLDPRSVTADAMRDGDLSLLPVEVLGTVVTAHLADRAAAADRRGLRRLGMAQTADPALSGAGLEPATAEEPNMDEPTTTEGRAAPQGPAMAWDVAWSALGHQVPHLTLAGHTEAVRAVAGLRGADGSWLVATGGDDRTVRIWEPVAGHSVVPAPEPHGDRILTLTAVTAVDGTQLLVITGEKGRRGTMRLWEVATGREHELPCPEWYVSSTSYRGPDGQQLIAFGTYAGRIHLFDPSTGKPAGPPLTGHTNPVTTLTTLDTHDNTRLVSTGDDGTVRVWDPETGRQTGHLAAECGPLVAAAMLRTADGVRLAVGSQQGDLLVWDPDSDELMRHLVREPGPISALAAISAGTVAVGSLDGVLSLHTLTAGVQQPRLLTGHRQRVNALAVLPTGGGGQRLVSCGHDRTAKVWNHTAARAAPTSAGVGAVRAVAPLATRRGLLLAASSTGQGLRMWNAQDGRPVPEGPRRPDAPKAMAGLIDGAGRTQLVVVPDTRGATDRPAPNVERFHPLTGLYSELFPARLTERDAEGAALVESVTAVAGCVGAPGLLLTGWSSGTVRVWDRGRGVWLHPWGGSGDCGEGQNGRGADSHGTNRRGAIRAVSGFRAPDGAVIVVSTAADGAIECSAVEGGHPISELAGHDGWVEGLASYYGPDGTPLLASAGEDGTVRVWDPLARVQRHAIPLGLPCRSLCTIGGLLAVGTDEGLLVLRLSGDLAITRGDEGGG